MSNHHHHITATIFDKRGRVLSIGHNNYVKTHPVQAEFAAKYGNEKKQFLHAEIDAILKCSCLNRAHRILITRFAKRTGLPRCAKPCPICEAAIRELTPIKIVEHT
jgi:tRNA(Arg) A34 adenosine deaminase TadA